MYIIVLCVFFVIFPCSYCSAGKVVSINVYEAMKDQVRITYCNVTNKHFTITTGEVILFNVTSERNINFVNCTFEENNLRATLKLREIKSNGTKDTSNNYKHYIYEFTTTVSGNWSCALFTHENDTGVQPISLIKGLPYAVSKCDMIINTHDSKFYYWQYMLLVGVVLIILMTIILFVGCALIYYKRKASVLHRLESLSSMPRPSNDRARYSKAPLKKPLVTVEHEDRGSVIYEALDTLQISQAPPVEPLADTLPRTPKAYKKDDTPSSSTSEISLLKDTKKKNKPKDKTKKVNKKMSLPSIGVSKSEGVVKMRAFSFGKVKNKAKAMAASKDKRTSIEKIKERPPLPLPIASTSDEEYEEMPAEPERTPEPTKHEFKIPSKPSKVQNTLTKATPPPNQIKPVRPALKPNAETVNELENILKKKVLGANRPVVSSTLRTGTMPKRNSPPVSNPDTAASTTIPRLKGTLPKAFPPLSVATKPTPPITPVKPLVSSPTKPTAKLPQPTPAVRPKPTKAPINVPLPPPISTLPSLAPSQREESTRTVTPKPMKPAPMDAPVPPPISTLPRPAPAIQVEQPDEEIYDNHWEGEDWTYEPIQEYNMYSM